MVLRKPYAFLIKHFNLIHIILTILMFLFFLEMRDVTNFLNEYIANNTYSQIIGVVGEHLSLWTYVLPFLIIIIVIVVMSLLKMKNKPVKYYLFTIIAYLIEFVVMIVAYSVLNSIQTGTPNPTFIQIYRDFISTISYLTIPFMLFSLSRGVGFNVRQFNFKKDLVELEISDTDNEEFEVDVEVDTEDLKAKLNRKFRFIKYVYLENKIAFFAVAIIFVLAIVLSVVIYINSIEKIYVENEPFSAYSLNLKVNDTYKTRYATNGDEIRKDKFYVIVRLNAQNTLNQDINIPYDNIYLRVDKMTKFLPIDNYRDEFSDFGLRFLSTDKVKANEERQIVLVYEIDLKYQNNPLRLEYLLKKAPEGEDKIYDYLKIDLEPKEYEDTKMVSEKSLGDKMTFDDSLISGTEIKIDEVEFNNRYSYKYKKLIGDVEQEFTKSIIPTDTSSYRKKIMRIKVDLKKNDKLNPKIYSSLYEKFANVIYEKDGKMIEQKTVLLDLTPSSSDYVYLEVMEEVADSNRVILDFKIRDKEYKYTLINKE